MSDPCELRKTAGVDAHCDRDECIYWRVVGHVGVDAPVSGCAVKYFELLDGGSEVAEWLLSVKARVETADGDVAEARTSPSDRQ